MEYLCECNDTKCSLRIPEDVFNDLSEWRNDHDPSLYIVHEDHIEIDKEVHRSGAYALVEDRSEELV